MTIASPACVAQNAGGLAKKPRPGWDGNEPLGRQGLPAGLRRRLPSHRGTPTVPFDRARPPPAGYPANTTSAAASQISGRQQRSHQTKQGKRGYLAASDTEAPIPAGPAEATLGRVGAGFSRSSSRLFRTPSYEMRVSRSPPLSTSPFATSVCTASSRAT